MARAVVIGSSVNALVAARLLSRSHQVTVVPEADAPEDDIGWIVAEITGQARRFVFASIACYPARTLLPNGENAHCTIRPESWWRNVFASAARERPELGCSLYFDVDLAA